MEIFEEDTHEVSLAYGNGPVSHHVTTTGRDRLAALVRTEAMAVYRP